MPDSHTPDTDSQWTGRTQLAAVFVGVIVLAAIVLSWLLNGRDPHGESPSPSVPAESTSAPAESGCPAGQVALSGTVTTAPPTVWSLVGRMAAPAVAGAGPARVEQDGYRHCFARTPTGALVAAANLGAMGSDPSLEIRIAQDGMMPGPLRDRVLASPAASGSVSNQPGAQYAAFRMVEYNAESAVVELVAHYSGSYVSATVEVSWFQGDWRWAVRGDGERQELAATYTPLTTLAGYTPWAGA